MWYANRIDTEKLSFKCLLRGKSPPDRSINRFVCLVTVDTHVLRVAKKTLSAKIEFVPIRVSIGDREREKKRETATIASFSSSFSIVDRSHHRVANRRRNVTTLTLSSGIYARVSYPWLAL